MRGPAIVIAVMGSMGLASYGCATSPTDDDLDAGGVYRAPGDSAAADASASADSGSPATFDSGVAADTGANDTGPSSLLDAATSDTGISTGHDAGLHDAGACVPVVSSQMPFDAGACPAPQSSTCGPGSLTGFMPKWTPPSGAHQGACMSSDVDALYTACFDAASTMMTCQEFQTQHIGCYTCAVSQDTDGTWGPVVDQANGLAVLNVAGCIALSEPCNLACAQAFQASSQCETKACATNCPLTTQMSLTSYDTCIETADSCGCQSYFDPGQCEASFTGAHPAAACTGTVSFKVNFEAIVALFCGS